VQPTLQQHWPAPARPRPIVIIGCGGIVNDAHLPAYRKADLPVLGVFDVDPARAAATAKQWNIARVFGSLGEAVGQPGVVFDVAVPPEFEFDVVNQLPDGATVQLQKPMGVDLADARRIRDACRRKKLIASVNLQLRFAPMMLAATSLIDSGALGQLVDLSFHFNLRTPWELFPFLRKLKRCEIQVHTVHHLDVCRHILGEPNGVYARTIQHPSHLDLASTKSSIILDYGPTTRAALSINHNYEFGPEDECADVRIQGTDGALRVSLGLLLNYPQGKPETLTYRTKSTAWTDVPIEGRWFPDGFVGTMSNLQRFAAGEDAKLVSSVEDAYRTMALVEACYASDASGGTPIPE
jgi:predicted dehydrogenase